jgi:hypothetical protein
MYTNNAKTKWMIYKELELIPDSVPQPKLTYPDDNPPWLRKIWQKFMDVVTPTYEPEVWQTTDRAGNIWWNVYNPITAQTLYMETEEEVMIWLDQYYGIG